jgi:hypothetical protein
MELVEGETLEARLARGALDGRRRAPSRHQIADALDAAHERKVGACHQRAVYTGPEGSRATRGTGPLPMSPGGLNTKT